MDNELKELMAKVKARWAAMTPAEQEAELAAQRASYVRAEMAFGSDADEAEYRRRLFAGDPLYDTPSGAPNNRPET